MPRRLEQNFHKAVATLLSAALPDDVVATTFPAGGGGRLRGAILKGLGLVPGMPDWLVAHAGRTLWLELKTDVGRLSAAQKLCHERLRRAGHQVQVCRSIFDVIDALDSAGVPHAVSKTRPT